MQVLQSCANQTCRRPVALDGCSEVPAGILCVAHLAAAGLGDLSPLDRVTRCQRATATCPRPTVAQTIIGAYCAEHAPMRLKLTPHTITDPVKQRKAVERIMKARQLRIDMMDDE